MREIKDILKQRRKELKLTMKEIADKAGVAEATISRWESGDIANMKRDKIVNYAKALEISPAVIMGLEELVETFSVSEHEKKVINAYRKHPELQNGIDSILQIEKEDEKAKVQEDIAKEVSEELRKNLDTKLNTI